MSGVTAERLQEPRVLILDYSVDRSEAPLFAEWLPEGCSHTDSYVFFGDAVPDPRGFTHVMHTGSSLSICSDAVFVEKAGELIRTCVERGIPQMGVCYGHQLLCRGLLGPRSVERCSNGFEVGWIDVDMTGSGLSIPGAGPVVRVLQSHFDRVRELPRGAEIIARNDHTRIQAFADRERKLLGFQFHPEFDRDSGNELFRNESALLTENGVDLEKVLADGPSISAGEVFFGYFLSGSWYGRSLE
ncbi:MAG: type 1 glutamine amidotransferase [Candidatus Aegiribacteria sp.]